MGKVMTDDLFLYFFGVTVSSLSASLMPSDFTISFLDVLLLPLRSSLRARLPGTDFELSRLPCFDRRLRLDRPDPEQDMLSLGATVSRSA
jgi:hypothetical protein